MNRIISIVIAVNIALAVVFMLIVFTGFISVESDNIAYGRAMRCIEEQKYDLARELLLPLIDKKPDARAWYYYCIAMDTISLDAKYAQKYLSLFESCYSGEKDAFYIAAVSIANP
ncbi:MAG: hypothetical protein IJA35_01575 [Clostridia bacterium]|nr:hypothetical protein [Clostridia bacterium]